MMGPFTLFYNDYSICSIMVRFTLAVARHSHARVVEIDEKYIDIQRRGQLAEYYLCEVNPKGTVPVLHFSDSSQAPLTESLDITHFLAEPYYPNLCPPQFAEQIKSLLVELHDINYFSLTYTNKPQRAIDMEMSVHKVLQTEEISERYKKALEFKLDVIRSTRAPALTKETVALQEEKANSFLRKMEKLLAASESTMDSSAADCPRWIFGTANSTALDAHVVPFLARLLDVGRRAMLEDKGKLLDYAERAFQTQAWKENGTVAKTRKSSLSGFFTAVRTL